MRFNPSLNHFRSQNGVDLSSSHTSQSRGVSPFSPPVSKHLQVLSAEGLVTSRPAYVMRGSDGTIVEVFEWESQDAIRRAHSNPAVSALWKEFDAACDYVPLARLPEANNMFAEFESIGS